MPTQVDVTGRPLIGRRQVDYGIYTSWGRLLSMFQNWKCYATTPGPKPIIIEIRTIVPSRFVRVTRMHKEQLERVGLYNYQECEFLVEWAKYADHRH